MSIHKTIRPTTLALLLLLLLLSATTASAHTHELIASFGPFEEKIPVKENTPDLGVSALAVDLETGNVLIADPSTRSIEIRGAMGGPPAGGLLTNTKIPFDTVNGVYADGEVAVDNSCYEHQPERLTGKACEEYDPSYGDVYVINNSIIDKYKLNAAHEYELAGELPGPFLINGSRWSIVALSVDPRGNLYIVGGTENDEVEVPYGSGKLVLPSTIIVELKKVLTKTINGGKEETEEKLESIPIYQEHPLSAAGERVGSVAVDGQGDLYVGRWKQGGEPTTHVLKLKIGETGNLLSEEEFGKNHHPTPVAVEPISGALYVGYSTEIQEYNMAGEPGLVFGSSELLGGMFGKEFNGAVAIAVDGPAGLIYVANRAQHDVDVFGPVVEPPAIGSEQPAATDVTRTSALVQGSVNPESRDGGSYYFEYAPASEYEPSGAEPYREGGRTPVQPLTGGKTAELTGTVALTGLLPGTLYHYRLVAHNTSGTVYGPDQTLTTAAATPPAVSTGTALQVIATGAVLTGTVGPRGLPTSYVFEVGTTTAYGGAKLFGNAGASTGTVEVSVALEYLVPNTTYHYRLAATSFDGTSYGADGTFTTAGVPSAITQPSTLAILATPVAVFPSIGGAITKPAGQKQKRSKRKKKHANNKGHGKTHTAHKSTRSPRDARRH